MANSKRWLNFLAVLLLVETARSSLTGGTDEHGVKTAVFRSPKIQLEPGSVSNKYYFDVGFPRGHIAVKSFDAEVVDEAGNSVPLYETYLHHWVAVTYYQRKGIQAPKSTENFSDNSSYSLARNDGMCQNALQQYFGLGSETRRTNTHIPDPYGIEFGNPAKIPAGYEEKWFLNVHAIDTRGAYDRLGCIECKCDLYNVTVDEDGKKLDPDYLGGLNCCYDKTRCRVKEGFHGVKRSLYLKYTVRYVDWHSSIVPVRVYVLDVTNKWTRSGNSTGNECQVEYTVEPCSNADKKGRCIDTKKASIILPTGGNLIYAVAHQHAGATGSTLYGEDGRVLCTSIPIYGKGKAAGNEAGYVVGMTTCFPRPRSVKISNGEKLTVVSNYSSARARGHTGVMGLFYILVADSDSSSHN